MTPRVFLSIARELACATGLASRGGLPESETRVGRLGFLHGVGCRAVLVDLFSMNTEDAAFGRSVGAQAAFARGLAAGCAAVLAPTAVAAR